MELYCIILAVSLSLQAILHNMTNPNIINYVNRRSALSYACEFNPSLVSELMKKGADATQPDVKSNSPVHFAAKSGSGLALQVYTGLTFVP